jgi:poly(A) polymerase
LGQAGTEGLLPDGSLTAQIRAGAQRVREIDPTRLYDLLTPPLCASHPHVALQWLRDASLLEHILPELEATVAFSQEAGRRHKDVWEHTKAVMRQSPPRPAVRWAAALHDIGKVRTRRFLEGGKVTFHAHAEEGARMFRSGPAKRIAFPSDVQEDVELLIRHHLRAGQYDGDWSDSAVRRFDREMGPILTDLLDLSRADVTSQRPGKRRHCIALIDELSHHITTLREQDAQPKALPAGLGNLLMSELELPPGKHIGDLRARLEALCDAGQIELGREPEYYLEAVRSRDLLAGLQIRPPRGMTR